MASNSLQQSDETTAGGAHAPAGTGQGAQNKALLLGALGIVYGDIGTSPLYTLREIFVQGGITPDYTHVLGALSLIFWTILLVVTVKYVVFVMRADNKGEGGALALTALALRRRQPGPRTAAILTLGILGAALFYGDAVITPAISVLGAVEGLKVAAPGLLDWVLPLTLLVLVALFLVQRLGTAGVGRFFGPVMLVWFLTLAILGTAQIVATPAVLYAVSPHHAVMFMAEQGWTGLLVFGAVVLCVTGAEALYADMGHFGRKPIRTVWFALVWPALLLNYFGQGALLITHPETIENPFYLLAPGWALIPLMLLATAAAVIAAQAVISGAFSLANQAVRLGYLPRLQVLHTSEAEIGQVYVPALNWLMLASVILLVLGFGSSSNLAAAYGIAVTGTMIVTTLLGYEVARRYGRMGRYTAAGLAAGFLLMDVAFFGANLLKVLHGGWAPLLIAGLVWFMISTWIKGRAALHGRRFQDAMSVADFLSRAERMPVRTARTAVYMTRDLTTVPTALLHNLKHNMVLHERVILMKVDAEEEPVVAAEERVVVERLGKGFYTVVARHGFMEDPDVPALLQACRPQGLAIDPMDVSYFLSRETLIPSRHPALPKSRERMFIMLHAISGDATRFFKLPPGQVVELGTQIEV